MAIETPKDIGQDIAGVAPGPLAIILNEDDVDLAATVAHHRRLGFAAIIQIGIATTGDSGADLTIDVPFGPGLSEIVNSLMAHIAGRWVYFGYNAEYLFFPFCESRSIFDLVQFVGEERREAVFCTTVDIYSDDLSLAESGLTFGDSYFDRNGYFSLDRYDGGSRLERQINVYGGLKWRFSEHVPWERQRIDRIALFRAREGLRMAPDMMFNDPEMNTVSCAWHNSLTCAVASQRVAKSLLRNPGSRDHVHGFMWSQSEPFVWRSQQLMDHGLMEPGQWF